MHFHRRVMIDCTPATVWRCLTEIDLLKQWITQFVDETVDEPERVGVGAGSTIRMREGGRVVAYRSVVTEWEPMTRLAIRLAGGSLAPGMEMDIAYDLSEEGMGTLVDYNVQVPLKGLGFKLMAPIIWLMAALTAKKDLKKLKAFAPTVGG